MVIFIPVRTINTFLLQRDYSKTSSDTKAPCGFRLAGVAHVIKSKALSVIISVFLDVLSTGGTKYRYFNCDVVSVLQ